MVTTRSADQQLSADTKTENLTLRSKPESIDASAVARPQPTASTSSSPRKRSTIFVNVPPPRKRTRLSHDGAADSEAGGSDSAIVLEISSSKTSAPSDARAGTMEKRSDLTESRGSRQSRSSSGSAQKGKRKVTVDENVHSNSGRLTPSANANHTRFGSEEPADDHSFPPNSAEPADSNPARNPSEFESESKSDDEAPEVTSTKAHPSSSLLKQRKKTRGQKSVPSPAHTSQDHESMQQRQASLMLEDRKANHDVLLQTHTTDPSLQQSGDASEGFASASAGLESDDSNDQSFETARTTRQKDAFATPEEGRSALTSPTLPSISAAHGNTSTALSFTDVHLPLDNLSSNLALMKVSRPKIKFRAVNSSATALPPKAANTLERHRRQVLQNRADKARESKRGGTFKLQEDWPGRRRRFVVGY